MSYLLVIYYVLGHYLDFFFVVVALRSISQQQLLAKAHKYYSYAGICHTQTDEMKTGATLAKCVCMRLDPA